MVLPLTNSELETELQEVYIQATHWLQDIGFLETETHFFRDIIDRYKIADDPNGNETELKAKIEAQYQRLESLKAKVPGFLAFVEPFICDLNKTPDLDFLGRYNVLYLELTSLFDNYRLTRNQLFQNREAHARQKAPNA
ncbi:hypothetical protein CKK33_13565 [Mucilaginibacter sp. MD40]|uniref:hypothetical protein n=1 Tax=Mucilaginibacter sp. MD40 TaxID=2029590 RepID=UPI000BACA19A|nr:hypothetical protein [Mucilaginibacter sp. MD40]PAW94462.1 hypothetical protein CKK33_13565 [Mucilaginibacter sp. MD40]